MSSCMHVKTNVSLKGFIQYYFLFRELQMALEQEKAQKRANLMKFSTRYAMKVSIFFFNDVLLCVNVIEISVVW